MRFTVHRNAAGVVGGPEAGDTPAQPVPVGDEAEAHRAFQDAGCACSARGGPAEERHVAMYAGQRLTVLSRVCGSCQRQHTLYFAITGR
jgi:hypothetical protein